MSSILGRYLLAYRNKITNKLFGVVFLPHEGKRKGAVLLSFITGPFTKTPNEFYSDPHSNYWTCPEIARLFSKRGYDVDIINWDNNSFIPRKEYTACIDISHNLKRFSPFLGVRCAKVMFILGSYPDFLNKAEQRRIDELNTRRGSQLPPKRTVPATENLQCADFVAGYGNKTVFSTFPNFADRIIPIPIPAMETYWFPHNKDFEVAKKHFLWFGGGGAILKGLDLVVEAFSTLPHLHLSIIGPSAYEKEFEKIYARELSLPNITRYGRPRVTKGGEIMVEDKNLFEVLNQCGATIFLSASEGGSGSVIHAMQAGLFPIITPQSGIDEKAPSIVIDNPTIENIKKAVEKFSNLPQEKVEELSRNTWSFARKHHTKASFTEAFNNFINTELKL